MADKSIEFSRNFHSYIFGNGTAAGVFALKPYKWAISIHDQANNPIGVAINSDWYYNSLYRKSVALVTGWLAISGDLANGVSNQNTISFDYVPSGQSWSIKYYIVWGISNNAGEDVVNPIYVGEFGSLVTLNELQVLQFSPGNFVINP